jgi:hypothetical protein
MAMVLFWGASGCLLYRDSEAVMSDELLQKYQGVVDGVHTMRFLSSWRPRVNGRASGVALEKEVIVVVNLPQTPTKHPISAHLSDIPPCIGALRPVSVVHGHFLGTRNKARQIGILPNSASLTKAEDAKHIICRCGTLLGPREAPLHAIVIAQAARNGLTAESPIYAASGRLFRVLQVLLDKIQRARRNPL